MPETGDAQPQVQIPAAESLQAEFAQGIALHQQGNLAEAERIFGGILQRQPNHFGALHRLGVIALHTRRMERGVELIRKAIGLNANVAAAHNNLGKALLDLKRPEEALASYDTAIALKPDFAMAYCHRGNVLINLKRSQEALASYDRAIALKPDYAMAHNNRGNVLHRLNRPADALASCDRAIALKPDYAMAHFNRGNILQDLKRPADALASYDRAIVLKPGYVVAHNNRGSALLDLKRPADALASYDRAIALKPDYVEAYYNRGNALSDLKRPADALASLDQAIALRPDFAEAYNNRGNALLGLGRPADALASFNRAIALKPDHAEAYNNRGKALLDLKRPAEALASYDKAITLKADYADAYWNQSICLLLMGRFEQGWRQYEWRKKCNNPIAICNYPQPLWLGEQNIAGKTLFIWGEQGLGDKIQFCRYAKLVEARGAKVILSVPQSLLKLLKQLSPTIELIGPDEVPNDFDYHCPMLSLPLAFGTTLETIPAQQQYLKADEELRLAWAARLPPKTKPRIGVVWSGGTANTNDQYRSIELEQLFPILSPDADWVCLQKEVREKDLAALRQRGRIAFFGDELRDFSDTAALLDLMDLVITVDTSVTHLAGAMGKPVWILLPYSPDWRWLLDRDDSPWYPSARLLRQQQFGNWAGVIDQVKDELRSVIG